MSGWNIKGYTGDKIEVHAESDPYITGKVSVKVNDEPVMVFRVTRARDGGTTYIHTSAGYLVYPRRLGEEDRRPRWNNEVVNVEEV